MRYRLATLGDPPTLARLNQQLVEDEGHRNRCKPYSWLEDRMRSFLQGGYRAVLFEDSGQVVAYALHIDDSEQPDTVCLRQFFLCRARRRQGMVAGKESVAKLFSYSKMRSGHWVCG